MGVLLVERGLGRRAFEPSSPSAPSTSTPTHKSSIYMDIKSSIALSSHVATAGIGLAITGTRFGVSFDSQPPSLPHYFIRLTFRPFLRLPLKLGIARAVTGGLATVAGAVIDQTLSLSTPQTPLTGGPASLLLSSLTSSSWDVVDYLAITPLILSQSITATSLNAAASLAHSVIGSSAESDFSLGAFVSLVQREVLDENQRSTLPEKLDYSFMSVLKALGAWAALQSVTSKSVFILFPLLPLGAFPARFLWDLRKRVSIESFFCLIFIGTRTRRPSRG